MQYKVRLTGVENNALILMLVCTSIKEKNSSLYKSNFGFSLWIPSLSIISSTNNKQRRIIGNKMDEDNDDDHDEK